MINEKELTLSAVVNDAAQILAGRLRSRLKEIESKGAKLKAELVEVKRVHAKDVEYYTGQIAELNGRNLLLEKVAELIPRPIEHQHDPDEPNPVLDFDLDGTLKPQVSQGDGGNYPIKEIAFPKVKYWLDRWSARKACIHLVTAGIYYAGPADLEIYLARLEQIQGWILENGLPVQCILPKIPSDIYYDDRMIVIPGDPTLTKTKKFVPDWDQVGLMAESDMKKRFDVVNGEWIRQPKTRIGKEIDDWPNVQDYPRDFPRGYSGPRLDVDMHRTLSLSSSSLRVAPPRPGALESITTLYESGVTIRISCAGWNPKTHTKSDSDRRLAGIRRWLMENSIPYDRIVTKDHADLYFDDKGQRFTSWEADLPQIKKRLPESESYKVGD